MHEQNSNASAVAADRSSVSNRDYKSDIAFGADQYRDATDGLTKAGFPAAFTQTGGMCAALSVVGPDGVTMLVTAGADNLPWNRDDQVGWTVGLYLSDEQDADEILSTNDSSVGALIKLVSTVSRT